MSRFHVEAEFTVLPRDAEISTDAIAKLAAMLRIHGGDAFGRPAGWTASMFVASSPSPADAGFEAGQKLRELSQQAGLPAGVMTDIHIRRVGGNKIGTLMRADDIEVSVRRPGPGPQGMHVPDMSSYVRVTHRPTGLYAESDTERSQLANKAKALRILQALVDRQAT